MLAYLHRTNIWSRPCQLKRSFAFPATRQALRCRRTNMTSLRWAFVVSGVFLERIGNDERTYSRGTASYCPAATTHSQRFGATGVRQIIFKPDSSWLEYLADCKARLDEAPHTHSATIRDLGDRLLGEMRQDDGFSAIACEGIMLEIVAAFGRDSTAIATNAKPPPWLRAARGVYA